MKTRLWLYNVRKEQRRVWPASVYLGGSVAIVTFASPWCDAWWPEENPPGARSCPFTVHLSRHFVLLASTAPSVLTSILSFILPFCLLTSPCFSFYFPQSFKLLSLYQISLVATSLSSMLLVVLNTYDRCIHGELKRKNKIGTNRMMDTILVAVISWAIKLNSSIVQINK